LEGYLHTFLFPVLPTIILDAIYFVVSIVAWMQPLAWLSIPHCFNDLPPLPFSEKGTKLPLVVWSHGLTGTGEEHSMLAASLALRGNVVALTHHGIFWKV